jgi:hypothetical protein
MGVIDAESVQNRSASYKRWPLQLANMVATACKYISGSRNLSDIPTTGLGAFHHVATYTPGTVLETRDPATLQINHATEITPTTYQLYHLRSLSAILEVRDPVSSTLSEQYQSVAHSNVELRNCQNNDQSMIVAPNTHFGAFWEYALAARGAEQGTYSTLLSHLPGFVRANPRRDASE